MSLLDNTLFVFTTSPAGLGHIRVMDAVKEGRPERIASVDIGIFDIKASKIHELGSRIKLFQKITEFYQTNKIAETFVTFAYILYLRRHTQKIVKYFEDAAQKYPNYKTWVVISTHFALAHSLSAAKIFIEQKLGIKIYLCVIVTDDSPQRVWAVRGSDLTFVPSTYTKERLQEYFPQSKRDLIKVTPFPVALRLSQSMTTKDFQFIIDQFDPAKKEPIQIEIPISGAAVQLDFFQKLMEILTRDNYLFTITGQASPLTMPFFNNIRNLPRVQVSIGQNAWQTVKYYESLFYQPNRQSIEITKPSEQLYKAILNPRQRGGVILLLTTPIGRQEYDNLNFLTRFGLIPDANLNRELYTEPDLSKYREEAKKWRALRIPDDPNLAANFIMKLKSSGIFYSMLSCVIPDKEELKDNGVSQIWEYITKLLQ